MNMTLEVGNSVRVLVADGPIPRGTIVSVRQVAKSGRVRVAGNGYGSSPTWLEADDVELVSANTPDVLRAEEAEAAPEPEPPEPPEPVVTVRRKPSRALTEDAPVVAVDAHGEVVEMPEPTPEPLKPTLAIDDDMFEMILQCIKDSNAKASNVVPMVVEPPEPSEYYQLAPGVEADDVIYAMMSGLLSTHQWWCIGNVIKYVARAGRKGDEHADVAKAQDYLRRCAEVMA